MSKALSILLIGLGLALANSAQAAPRSIDDCEKIDAPDAYNQCLASFGPTRKSRGASRAPQTRAVRGKPAIRSHKMRIHTGGRQRMEFSISPR